MAAVVLFGVKQMHITVGDEVIVTGTVEEYNGRREIIADRIDKT